MERRAGIAKRNGIHPQNFRLPAYFFPKNNIIYIINNLGNNITYAYIYKLIDRFCSIEF